MECEGGEREGAHLRRLEMMLVVDMVKLGEGGSSSRLKWSASARSN